MTVAITMSDQAHALLRGVLLEQPPEVGARLTASSPEVPGEDPRYALTLDLARAGDLTVTHRNVPFLVAPEAAPIVDGVHVDLASGPMGGFVVARRGCCGGEAAR